MKKTQIKFITICIIMAVMSLVLKSVLNLDDLVYNSLVEKFTDLEIKEIFKIQEKWQWLSYVFIPIFVFFKTIILSSILYLGIYFTIKEVEFKKIWEIVINAEFIFLIVPFIKLIWFYFFKINYTLDDFQYFIPFSIINITGHQGLDPWLIYPFQTLNLLEVAYIIYLSYQIGYLTKTNADNGLKIVCYSYVPALLLWVAVVMFFTLNYS